MSVTTNGRTAAGTASEQVGPAGHVADPPVPAEPAHEFPHPNGSRPAPASELRPEDTNRGSAGTLRVTVRPRRRPLTPLRWLVLVLLALVLVAAGAWAGKSFADRQTTMYAAHTDVLYPLVQEQPTGFLRQDRNLSTQEVLLASRTVLDPVATQFGVSADDLADELTTEVVDESEVIRVQFTDPSRAQARKVLLAIVTQYVAVSNNPQRTALRAYLDTQLADVQARLVTARADADAVGDLGLTQAAQAQVNALVTREASLQAQIDEDQLAAIAGPAPQVMVPPYVEHEAVSPKPLLATAGGALAGLAVALVVVAAVARRMTRP